MTCLRTLYKGIPVVCLLLAVSCNQEPAETPQTAYLNNTSSQLVQEWAELSLDLSTKCNGFNDPIASRSLYYMSATLYESLLPGLKGYQSLQARISGLNTTLPQPDRGKTYNWHIVSNQALALVCVELYKASGPENLNKITLLRDKNIQKAGVEVDPEIIRNSIELGNAIGWKMIDYAATDGQSEAYLMNFPDYTAPSTPGSWIPTPPDYSPRPLLPYWGDTRPVLQANILSVKPAKSLSYSTSTSSIMYAEATELYNLSSNLNPAQRELYEYWNYELDPHASPVCHNTLLAIQLIKDKELTLDASVELLLRISMAQYDGYIIAWKTKFESPMLRPSSYIKQNINRYYIPEYGAVPVPEFVSEDALIYSACSEILGHYFGYRTPFIDFTQSGRLDLREDRKYFESFNDMAKEASYSDLLGGIHFRTSIDAGFQMGYDLAQNVLGLDIKE